MRHVALEQILASGDAKVLRDGLEACLTAGWSDTARDAATAATEAQRYLLALLRDPAATRTRKLAALQALADA